MKQNDVDIDGRSLQISHPHKVYFPDIGLTKGNLIAYYRRVAEVMLPHLRQRPLSLQRFPNGINEDGFYQKEAPDYFPDWIERVMVQVEEEKVLQPQVVCNYAATLVYLANQGCITPHAWLSRADDLQHPDRLVFDLDPPGEDFDLVRTAARALRTALIDLGLTPFVMTTGSRGLHVTVPLDRSADFDTVRAFARQVADTLAGQQPDKFTTEVRKEKRNGRLFLDYLRNAYAQTAVPPYAVRPLPGAPVATPLSWNELDRGDLHSQRYTVNNIFQRLGQKADPWQEIDRAARPLPTLAAEKS
ncbi:MAG: non-homologous end-joining DNA ligase [Anaerolineaceae bacterium]|nr:non-homologous end-joining DNA ligase [Anaerolineaceae bacterium]